MNHLGKAGFAKSRGKNPLSIPAQVIPDWFYKNELVGSMLSLKGLVGRDRDRGQRNEGNIERRG